MVQPTHPSILRTETAATASPDGQWQETVARVLTEEILELLGAETQLFATWSSMALAVCDPMLRANFERAERQTQQHRERLDLVARLLGIAPTSLTCLTVEGLLLGVRETIEENHAGLGRDAGLLSAAQKIVNYQINAYCCARDFAQLLALDSAAKILQRTIDENCTFEAQLANLQEFTKLETESRLFR